MTEQTNHLQNAKDALIWGEGDGHTDEKERLKTAAALATANALIALVEMLDRLTFTKEGGESSLARQGGAGQQKQKGNYDR